jgi:secreted trypsin-like serine protease
LNTKEPRKEMEYIAKEMKNFLSEYVYYVNNKIVTIEDRQFRERVIFRYMGSICNQEYLTLNDNVNNGILEINPDIKGYISNLINDVAIYAENEPFPTPAEQIEKMDLLAENLYNELERVNI